MPSQAQAWAVAPEATPLAAEAAGARLVLLVRAVFALRAALRFATSAPAEAWAAFVWHALVLL